jgi:hypothetical protein
MTPRGWLLPGSGFHLALFSGKQVSMAFTPLSAAILTGRVSSLLPVE